MRATSWPPGAIVVIVVLAGATVALGIRSLTHPAADEHAPPPASSTTAIVPAGSPAVRPNTAAAPATAPGVGNVVGATPPASSPSPQPVSPTTPQNDLPAAPAPPPETTPALSPPPTADFHDVVAAPSPAGVADDIEPPGLTIDPNPMPKATASYLEGLEALAAANWKQATDNFSAAIDAADSDVPDYFRARGIAYVLAERLPEATKDLRRATQLDQQARETRVWLAAAIGMSGDPMNASNVYPPATTDPYETFVGQMRVDYGQLTFFQKINNPDPKFVAQRAAAKQRFAQAAAWFVSRVKSSPAMVQTLMRRAKQRFAQGQFAAALDDLDYVRPQQPDDIATIFFHAGCLAATGDPATAWQEYTQILTRFTAFGQGYGARAQADALLGDPRRARADLAIAASLRPQDAAKLQGVVEQQLAKLKAAAPADKPEVLRAAIEKSALGGAALDALVEQALALHKAVQARSLNQDEIYQQRLKTLEDAQRAAPRDVDRLVALAEFITREAKARNNQHAPPGQFRLLEPEIPRDPDGEFARAEQLADQALAINPNSAPALVAKARLYFEFRQFGDADRLLQQALAIQRDVPDGLELWARVLTVGASQASANAINLESPQSGSTTGFESIIYWTRYPSAEELRQAAEFRQIARQRLQQAREIFEQAVKLRPNDAAGYFDLGTWRLSQQDLPGAQQAFEKATQLSPKMLTAHQALAKVYRDQGLTDKAFEEDSLVTNETEGAVSDLLAQAWQEMSRTGLKKAAKLLAQAALAEPADARVPAYLGIVRLADDRAVDGEAEVRLAVALEAARLAPRGITGKNLGAGRLNPDDLALLMMLRNRLSALESAGGHAPEALQLAKDNLALEPRIQVADMLRKLPTSVLPIVGADVEHRQQPECAASLLAWSHCQAGAALAAANQIDQATAEYQACYMVGRAVPNIIGMEPLMEPRFRAGIALVQILYNRGDVQGASQLLNKVSGEASSTDRAQEAQRLRQSLFNGRFP